MKKFIKLLPLILVTTVSPILFSATQQDDSGAADIEALIASAEAGYAEAQVALGQIYSRGDGVPQDTAMALKWMEKAAEFGHTQAKAEIARPNELYQNTDVIRQNFARSQFSLAMMHLNGNGAEKDIPKAIELLQSAADAGNADAQNALAGLYMDGDIVEKDIVLAIELYLKAANQGQPVAMEKLSNIFAEGKYIGKDLDSAIQLFLKSAEAGYVLAQYKVGLMYQSGQYLEKDVEAALYWLRKAAGDRFPMAQEDLGYMFFKGDGVEKDEIEGLAWLYLAVEGGPADATRPITTDIAAFEREAGVEKTQAARQRRDEIRQSINSEYSARYGTSLPEPVGEPIGSGSGVVISRDGLILASARIVAGAGSIKIKTFSPFGKTLTAEILEIDKDKDIAILKYDESAPPKPVAESENLRIGQDVRVLLSPTPAELNMKMSFNIASVRSLTGVGNDSGYFQIGSPPIASDRPIPEDIMSKIKADQAARMAGILNSAAGPVYDESGNLVGMIPFQSVGDDGMINVLRTENLRTVLWKYGVEVIEPSENENGITSAPVIVGPAGKVPPIPPLQNPGSIVMILTYE